MAYQQQIALLITCIIALSMLLYIQLNQQAYNSTKPYIVCTTNIIADVVKNIGNDAIEVVCLMGPGVDPHLYKPVESDIIKIASADIIFYNGLHLEAKMAELFEHLAYKKTTVAVTKDIPQEQLISVNEYHQIFDPHVWFHIKLWQYAVQTIATTIVAKYPHLARQIYDATQRYCLELEQTDITIKQWLEQIPNHKRILITGHDAFSYFAQVYNFQVIGLQGMSTESSPGIYDIENIVNLICSHNIPAIFIESSIPIKHGLAIQQAVASNDKTITIGGQLYSDALGNEDSPGNNYINMLLYNAQTIASALS